MRRRTVLAAAVGGLAAGAGCTDPLGIRPDGTGDPDGTDDPNDERDPDDREPIADVGCPSFDTGADRTVCFRDRGDAAVYVAPSAYTFEEYGGDDEVETLGLTVHNDGDRVFEYDPYDWTVYRYGPDAGEWVEVASGPPVEPLTRVAPGGTVTYSLATTEHPSPNDDVRAIIADLDSGHTHAFRVAGHLGGGGPRIELVARFDYLRAVP